MYWTKFMDMHSGGGTKTEYEYIYIEADEDSAVNVFCNMFDEHPYSVACGCCGSNFSVSTYESLEEATSYERKYNNLSVEEYLKEDSVKVVYSSEITKDLLEDTKIQAYEDTYYEDDY